MEDSKYKALRIRVDKGANYFSIFTEEFRTIRCRIIDELPITRPSTPEISDIAINNKCLANCPYCYISALKSGTNFDNICEKAKDLWGTVPMNNRPFQIAIGGAGEPTLHPDFPEFVKVVRELGIIPNYTTNGMHLTDSVLQATKDYCGGVAISWHPHLGWAHLDNSIKKLYGNTKYLNVHVIIGTEKSLEDLKIIYDRYGPILKTIVLLPLQKQGRSELGGSEEVYKKMFDFIREKEDKTKFAVGALFYEYLKANDVGINMSIYEPEIYSGYREFDDSYKVLKHSSYNREAIER